MSVPNGMYLWTRPVRGLLRNSETPLFERPGIKQNGGGLNALKTNLLNTRSAAVAPPSLLSGREYLRFDELEAILNIPTGIFLNDVSIFFAPFIYCDVVHFYDL